MSHVHNAFSRKRFFTVFFFPRSFSRGSRRVYSRGGPRRSGARGAGASHLVPPGMCVHGLFSSFRCLKCVSVKHSHNANANAVYSQACSLDTCLLVFIHSRIVHVYVDANADYPRAAQALARWAWKFAIHASLSIGGSGCVAQAALRMVRRLNLITTLMYHTHTHIRWNWH